VIAARSLPLVCILLWAIPAFAADVADDFRLYYRQQVAGGAYKGPLDFLRDGKGDPLTAGDQHQVTIDRANGYLQVSDSRGTDQVLTMAVYRRADGTELLVVGSSDCADACTFAVELFTVAADRLQPVAGDSILPAVEPSRFIRAGRAGPKNAPTINYVPARVGTSLTLKPWYGYEVEAQMDDKTRAAIQDVTLIWDRAAGRFR
jgi:hypothetical protein